MSLVPNIHVCFLFCNVDSLAPTVCYGRFCMGIPILEVPRVAQRYGTIAAHTLRRVCVLVVFVMFCLHMHSFACLIRRTPPPTFSDTAITYRRSDTTILQLRAHWVLMSWSIGSEQLFRHVPPVGVKPCVQGEHPIH